MEMRLDSLTLTARDLPRARAFYSHKLGFRVVEERDGQAVVFDAGGVRLTIDGQAPRSALAYSEPRLVFQTSAVAECCLALRDLGVSVEGPRQGAGGLYAELTDPDGHPITLVERQR